MLKYFFGLITLLQTIKELISLGFVIFRWVRDNYCHYEERKEVVKEVKAAIQETLKTEGDTQRLYQVVSPQSRPFPRGEDCP